MVENKTIILLAAAVGIGLLLSKKTTAAPAPTDITAIDMSIYPLPSECPLPCTLSVTITWQNVGSAQSTFQPKYKFGTTEKNMGSQITLLPDETVTRIDTFSIPTAGSYDVCPIPN